MSKKKKEFIQVKLSDDQAIALKAMQVFKSDKTKKEFVLDGVGGTGKTFLIRELFSRKRPNSKKTFVPNTILGIAVTHQAVLNLKKSIPNSKTYASAASLMMEFDLNGNIYFIPKSGSTLFGSLKGYKHIVVDECSQFSVEMMNVLIRGASPDTKFYWIGDHHQLPPIGLGGDKDSPTFDTKDHYRLTEKIRQKKGDYIAELGDLVCEKIDTDHDLSFLNELENKFNKSTKKGYAITTIDNVISSFVRNFKDGKDVRITSYRNKRIADINNVIRRTLWGDDSDSLYVVGEFIILNDQYSPNGFPIAFNGQTFKIKKISIESVEYVECYILSVDKNINLYVPTLKGYPVYKKQIEHLKALSISSKDWSEYIRFKSQYANISYGYAINNYKIQGSTVEGCYVDLSDILDVKPISAKRKLQAFYVGISRPTTFLGIF